MTDINGVIAAYTTQMQRAYRQRTRGIATPEQRAVWRREAVAAIDAIAARAWDEGYRSGGSRAMRRMSDEPHVPEATNPYRESEG